MKCTALLTAAAAFVALATAGCGGGHIVVPTDLDKSKLESDVVAVYNSTPGATANGASCTISGNDAHCMVTLANGMQTAYDLVINANGDGFSQR